MLRRQREIRAQVQKFMDAGLFCIAFFFAHAWREKSGVAVLGGTPEIAPFHEYVWMWLIIFPLAPFILETHGYYKRPMVLSRSFLLLQGLKACTTMAIILIATTFLFREQPARSVILLFAPLSFCMLMLKEELMQRWLASRLGQAQIQKRLLLLGAPEDTARLLGELNRTRHFEFEVVAQLDLNETATEQLVEMLHTHSVNGVVLSAKHTYFGHVEKAIQACELEGVEAWLLADFFNTQLSQTTLDDFYGRPMLVFRTTQEESWQAVAKHALDVLGALALLLLTSPLLIIAAVGTKLTSPGPIFFVQTRSGLNGRPFKMIKFRTMVTNAEQRKHELASMNEMGGPVFKMTNDPRITTFGRWLRKYSIDELPQLLNVLRGEMSLVGPRPLPVDETMKFNDFAHRRRLSVKPGLTCLWQVSGRNNVRDFSDWVRLDLEYIDNWSLWLDLKILLRTIPVVLMGTGAK
ncbi:MAG TPA: sugar transferase [Methylomirabilota bacterium]|nr:sugar transferase [Methylomirabilota bacterium]